MLDFKKLKEIFFYSSLSKEEFEIIEGDLKKRNVSLCVFLSGLSFLSMVAMYFYSYVFDEWSSHRHIYAYYSFVYLVVHMSSYMNKLSGKYSHLLTIYPYFIAFFSFTLIDSIIHTPDSVAVEPIVGLFLLSSLFYMRLLRIFIFMLLMTIVNSVSALIYCADSVKMVNVSNFVIYGILLFLLGYYLNRNLLLGVLNEHKAVVAGYLDLMTGLNNRNYYNTVFPYLGNKVTKKIACVYIDANDLHSLNNTKGHEAGDRMLVFIANSIIRKFGKELSFRIGGDEFVIFVVDFEEDVRKKCRKLKEEIETEGYHISLGIDICEDTGLLEMERLVKTAESRMYEDKRLFYQEKGRNRRQS